MISYLMEFMDLYKQFNNLEYMPYMAIHWSMEVKSYSTGKLGLLI
jgi:hypothetical protein